MQKYVGYLEKYVEWIAVGLGALFFVYMAMTYLVGSPVSESLNGTNVTVRDVDENIADHQTEPLQRKMANAQVPSFVVQDFSSAVTKGLEMDQVKAVPVAIAVDHQPFSLEMALQHDNLPKGPIVAALPTLPAADPVSVESGNSSVLRPIVVQAAPILGPGDEGGAPAAAADQQLVAGQNAVRIDMPWATAMFTIPLAPLSNQWVQCFGPPAVGANWILPSPTTEFLSATLYREEKSPAGVWGQPQEIARLFNNPLPQYPKVGVAVDESAYARWAPQYQSHIITPPFPQPAIAPAGTIWKDPLVIIQAIMNPPVVVPATPVPGPVQAPAPPPRPVPQQRTPFGPYGPPRMPGGAGPGYPPPPRPPVQSQPQLPPAPNMPAAVDSTDPDVVSVHGITIAAMPSVVTTSFNPAANVGVAVGAAQNQAGPSSDILVYLHDDTIKAGHTYRYRLSYKLLNPLFRKNQGLVAQANLSWLNQLALESPMSGPSPAISPQGRMFFFCAQNYKAGDSEKFSFNVYTWSNGIWQKQKFEVTPGDAIGGVVTLNGTDVDFSTGVTYITSRSHSNHVSVTLADPTGEIQVRDAEADMHGKDQAKYEALYIASKPPTPGP